jgi:hypothetical protein
LGAPALAGFPESGAAQYDLCDAISGWRHFLYFVFKSSSGRAPQTQRDRFWKKINPYDV